MNGKRIIPRTLKASLLSIIVLASSRAAASECPQGDLDCANSVDVANSIIDEIDHARLHELWNSNTSSWMKSKGTEDFFIAFMYTISQALSFGVANRKILTEGAGVDPASNLPFYGRLYLVTLSNGRQFYESITLIKENGKFKLSGAYLNPAPTS